MDISADLDAWVLRSRGKKPRAEPSKSKGAHGPTSKQLIGRKGWGETTDHRGVYRTVQGKFAVKLTRDKRRHYVGTFATEAEAIEARRKYLEVLDG